jgi:hypothetical protein
MRKRRIVFAVMLVLVLAVVVLAQGDTPASPEYILGIPKPLFARLTDIGIGVAITAIVSFLKASAWVKSHPKLVAAALAVLGSIGTALADVQATDGIWPYIASFITQLTTSIGTFEIAKTTTKAEEI